MDPDFKGCPQYLEEMAEARQQDHMARMRKRTGHPYDKGNLLPRDEAAMEWAVAEIERLTSANLDWLRLRQQAVEERDAAEARIVEQQAEIELLRAALNHIATLPAWAPERDIAELAVKNAREALANAREQKL